MGHYECKKCGQQHDKCECKPDRTVVKGSGRPLAVKKARRKTDKAKPVLGLVNTRVDELDDFSGALYALKAHVERLIHRYGPEARIYFDAGHNNVSVMVEHRPARYGTLNSLPDAAICAQVELTVGRRYAIRDENDSGELLIETDCPGEVAWVHKARMGDIRSDKDDEL